MSDSATLQMVSDKVTQKLNNMVSKSQSMQAFFVRVIYPMYKNFQMNRWQTQGASEGIAWDDLSPLYAARKRIIYGGGPKHEWIGGKGPGRPWKVSGNWPSYPGAGSKVMIATGRLASAAIGPNSIWAGGERFHRMKADNQSITISLDSSVSKTKKDIGSEYFKEADKERPIMKFSDASIDQMRQKIKEYIKATSGTF